MVSLQPSICVLCGCAGLRENWGMAEHWCPVFEAIIDSSIWEEPDYVRIVFLTMLFKKDHQHMVYGTAFNIASWARKTEVEVLKALKILSSPDRRRIEKQEHDGIRIQKVADRQWFILNGKKYQDLMVENNERSRKRRWAAEKRAQEKEEKRARAYADKHGSI